MCLHCIFANGRVWYFPACTVHCKLWFFLWEIHIRSLPAAYLFAEPIEVNLPAKEEMRNFDSVIVNFLREQGIPGASLCIAKGGHVIYTQSKNAVLEYYILSDRKYDTLESFFF